ncbi:MAG: trimeric intracellular cation channel family protein [Woeseiaceae bacterium]
MNEFLISLDLMGTFVFAISGATVGVRQRLDLFGVLVLSFAAATAGGMTRDVLIGDVPPVALVDWRYLAVSCLAGLITFYRYSLIEKLRNPVQVFDAAGLALFAVTGASKALSFGLAPITAVLLGMLSGIGGGMARDMLVAQIPVILRTELYAVAALAGAAVVVVGDRFEMPPVPVMLAGALFCFGLRFMAIRYGWRLPIASHRES